jgi:hypothetical protein
LAGGLAPVNLITMYFLYGEVMYCSVTSYFCIDQQLLIAGELLHLMELSGAFTFSKQYTQVLISFQDIATSYCYVQQYSHDNEVQLFLI